MTNHPLWKLLGIGLAPLLLVLASCGEPNPLLGHWEYDKEKSGGLAAAGTEIAIGVTGVDRIEFREDKMVSGSKSETVTYEVTEDRVIVTRAGGEGDVYTIVDENTVILDGATGRIAYRRVPPPVAAPAEEATE